MRLALALLAVAAAARADTSVGPPAPPPPQPSSAPVDPFRAQPLWGPFPSLDAWCRGFAEKYHHYCDPVGEWRDSQEVPAGAPFLELRHLETADRHGSLRMGHVALRTARGWWVTLGILDANEGQHAGHQSVYLGDLEVRAGTPPILEIRVDAEYPARDDVIDAGSGAHGHDYYSSCAKSAVWCAVGAAGAPACTGAVRVAYTGFCDQDHRERRDDDDGRLTVGVHDGVVELGVRRARKRRPSWIREVVGRHQLQFP